MMYGWPIVSILLFAFQKPRQAIILSLFIGWLLLPQAVLKIQGLPDYSRFTAVMLGIILGIAFFDLGRIAKFRIKRFDLPMIILCLCPFASSISNNLGIYDGISSVFTFAITFGFPYFIGRIYFADQAGIRMLASGLVLSMLWYVPLILYELRMSPQLHKNVYGYLQIPFHMIWRFGWYRPLVFLSHGLELGILMAGGALTAFWLWQCKSVQRFGWFSAGITSAILLVMCLLCRALNGYVILTTGLGTLLLTKTFKARIFIIILALLPQVYVFGRVATNWDAAPLVEAAESINPLRARSLQSRISHEITLIDKALRRPFFGWGGWGRNRADELAEGAMGHTSTTDSFWIIIFGQRGLVGLFCVGLVLLWPIIFLLRRLPITQWASSEHAPAAALSMVLLGFTIDCLFNAMASPIYFVIAGSLIAYHPSLLTNQNI